jgi:hypothetical protein
MSGGRSWRKLTPYPVFVDHVRQGSYRLGQPARIADPYHLDVATEVPGGVEEVGWLIGGHTYGKVSAYRLSLKVSAIGEKARGKVYCHTLNRGLIDRLYRLGIPSL